MILVQSKDLRKIKYIYNESIRKRRHAKTRIGCQEKFYVNKFDDRSWLVSLFEENDNHAFMTLKNKKSLVTFSKKCQQRSSWDDMENEQGRS